MKSRIANEAGGTSATPNFLRVNRWMWLVLGCVSAMLACGARWDIAVLAWLAPIFLILFSRASSVGVATIGVLAATMLQMAAYLILTAIPINGMTALLGVVVSTAYAIPYILDRTIGNRLTGAERAFLFPVAAVAAEFGIGSILPLGTAIGMRAITQGENLALVQISSVTGPYVIAFLIGCAATIANGLIENPRLAASRRNGVWAAMALVAIMLFGQARLVATAPSATASSVKIAAITPDRDARLRANNLLGGESLPAPAKAIANASSSHARAQYAKIWQTLLRDTRSAARAGAKIIVWSETAAPSTEADKSVLLTQVAKLARDQSIYILASIGVPFERNENFLFGPDGRQLWHYRKNHPVPGMEPVAPFDNPVPVVSTPYGRLASLICFDGDFPALARVDADIMLTPSWDWPEVGYAHTMRMVRLRAVENGYALFRPVFNGLIGAFDPSGRPLAMQETMSGGAHVTIVDVPIHKSRTIYNRIGDVFAWLCVLGMISLALAGAFRTRRRQSASRECVPAEL